MSFKCLGCDCDIGWDGSGLFSFTCPCGSRVLYDSETLRIALPSSLVLSLATHRATPHLNYIVGESDSTSPLKERFIEELRRRGFIWMEECEQCKKDGTLARKQEREKYLAVKEAEAIVRRENDHG